MRTTVLFRIIFHVCLVLVTTNQIDAGIADRSIILSTAKELMDEEGKPMTNVANKLGMSQVAEKPAFQTAEEMGMMVANKLPPVQAARTVYNGAKMAGQVVKGMITSGMGK